MDAQTCNALAWQYLQAGETQLALEHALRAHELKRSNLDYLNTLGVAYGEANPGAIAVAIQQGADIRIVSDNVLTIAEFAWMVKKDSPIKTIKDLKGRKIGYTNPRSTSSVWNMNSL